MHERIEDERENFNHKVIQVKCHKVNLFFWSQHKYIDQYFTKSNSRVGCTWSEIESTHGVINLLILWQSLRIQDDFNYTFLYGWWNQCKTHGLCHWLSRTCCMGSEEGSPANIFAVLPHVPCKEVQDAILAGSSSSRWITGQEFPWMKTLEFF